jgi:hypothetical protein
LFEATPSTQLTLGDIVSRGIRRFRLNYGFYYYVFTITALLINLPIYLIHWCFRGIVEGVKAHGLTVSIFFFVVGILLGVLALMVGQFQVAVRNTAVLRMTALPPMKYDEAFKYAKERQWKAFALHWLCGMGIFFLVFFSVAFASIVVFLFNSTFLFLTIPLVGLDLILMSLAMAWMAIYVQLIYAVFACEDLPFGAIFGRAAKLTTPNVWRGSAFVCILFVVMVAVKLACDFPVAIGNAIYFAVQGFKNPNILMTPSNSPVVSSLQLAGHVWESVTLVISLSVSSITAALFYTDVRQRLEGQDILSKLAQLEGDKAMPSI